MSGPTVVVRPRGPPSVSIVRVDEVTVASVLNDSHHDPRDCPAQTTDRGERMWVQVEDRPRRRAPGGSRWGPPMATSRRGLIAVLAIVAPSERAGPIAGSNR